MHTNPQEVFHHVVELNVVRYIAAILDYVSADILKVCRKSYVHVHIVFTCTM